MTRPLSHAPLAPVARPTLRVGAALHTLRVAAAALAAALALSVPVDAQVEANPVLSGLVQRAGEPLGGSEVVLHRVDAAEAGALDTIMAEMDGTFRFGLPTVPDPGGRGEIYFASVDHQGVLYFGPPVATAAELDSVYRIEVFDTLTAPPGGASLPVTVRYLLIDPTETGWSVTDLVEFEVPGDRTLVSSDSTAPTWQYLLPSGVRDVQVGGGDIAPVSTTFRGDTVSISMPLTPGPRQLVLRYATDSLALEVPLPGETGELEVLVREPVPAMEVTGLVAVEPVELEPGVIYRRYAAAMLSDSVVSFRSTGDTGGGGIPLEVLVVVIALALTAVGVWAVRRAPPPVPVADGVQNPSGEPGVRLAPLGPEDRKRVLVSVARIDERLEGEDDPAEVARLQAERDELMMRLRGG